MPWASSFLLGRQGEGSLRQCRIAAPASPREAWGPVGASAATSAREGVVHPQLVESFRSMPTFRELRDRLPSPGQRLSLSGLAGAAPSLLVAALRRERPERLWVVVAPGPDAAEEVLADLLALLGEDEAVLFPQREALPYEQGEPHLEIGGLRVEALEAVLSGRTALLVTTPRALQELSPSIASLGELRLELHVGQEVRPAELAARLEAMGLERVPTVEEVGQFALRGGILDVFGFGTPEPGRLEFWGDEIESIRQFDILTQLSVRNVASLQVLPVDLKPVPRADRELSAHPSPAETRRSLLDYLPDQSVVVNMPEVDLETEWRHMAAEVQRLHAAEVRAGRHVEAPEHLYLHPDQVSARLESRPRLVLERAPSEGTLRFGVVAPEPIERDMARLGALLREANARGEQTIVLCDNEGQLERLQDLLEEMRVAGGVSLDVGALSGGFVLGDAFPPLRVLTDHEIFRRTRRLRRRRQFRGGATLESFAALKPGEYVVHLDHGIGRFRGVEEVRVGETILETLVIEYAGGELLRVPVHRIDVIERWVSDSEDVAPPKVHRIGGKTWQRTKQRTQKAIDEMTAELLELYAVRKQAHGFSFSPDTGWQREMESAFLFEDTPDQRQASEDVKRDMEAPRPMDRLVCGDVGYGKTEVAIRAVFKAVQDGKQAAVLVPTTILAEQHHETFAERLAGFPIRIEALSRFRTVKEQKAVLEGVKSGTVDVVIGTHRLLSADVEFKDLGLLIVDEEQRFGVRHKERLKQMRAAVDVLTLTATPIPRTLHFSLLGLRDMTLIQTPPRDRQPIITHVLPWSDAIIEDALRREVDRGGQVFFVHNRIDTIDTIATRVQALIPDAGIGVAHGQMREKDLEEVMSRFVHGELDVLVATAIIESGLDVPRANTLIVHRADQFGLAQLYQIRGRVGRSHHRAYCYLLIPEDIAEDAEKRLRVLEHHTELGSGYGIALKDLELRGAGNILGSAQSGFVHAVGMDTYMRLLEQTIRRLKGEGQVKEHPQTEVSVDGAALIPEEYVPDEAQKLHLYRRLSKVRGAAEIETLRRELRDRYGPLPPEAETLLATATLRLHGTEIGVERILVRPWEARVTFRMGVVPRMAALQAAFAERQLEIEMTRTMPLSLVLHRRGAEPITRALDGALATLIRSQALAA
jgi:transcription-repair coupling factor (superfamily II helicase)